MKRSKFFEEQYADSIRQAESGIPVGDLCRQLKMSDATFDAWKKVHSTCCRRPCEKSLRPARRRELAAWFHDTFHGSCLRACRLAQFRRVSWYRRSHAKNQSA